MVWILTGMCPSLSKMFSSRRISYASLIYIRGTDPRGKGEVLFVFP